MVEGKITNAYAQRTTYFDLLQAKGTSSEIRSKLSIDLEDENGQTVYSTKFATGLQGEWGPVNAGRLEKIDHQNLTIILKTHDTKQILDKKDFPWKGISDTKSNFDDSKIQSYQILKNLEQEIRRFIEKELSENNQKWWKQLIPGDVKDNAEKRKNNDEKRKNWDFEEQPLISYIDYNDYEKIITRNDNWKEIFQFVFRDQVAISGKLKEIEPIRNAISHTRNLDPYEEKQLRFYSEEILRTISYYYNNKEKIKEQKVKKKIEKEERMPVIQSDKSVYLWGTDMILTVIDPDADKDSNKPEFVGDRPDSKLIIESRKGKLENYRLRETGDSTGIFQGIIGFVGIRNNGDIEPYRHNDKLIKKTQGKEVDDGFLIVSEDDELKITYSNLKGTAELSVYVILSPEASQLGF